METSAISTHCELGTAESGSWAVCTTAREDPYILQKFVDHHIRSGAGQIYVYLDRPSPDMLEWSSNQTDATIIVCDASDYGSQCSNAGSFIQFQMNNFRRFVRESCKTKWAIHIDADEFVSSEQCIALLLGNLGTSVDAVQLLPAEPVFGPTSERNTICSFGQTYARIAFRPAAPQLLRRLYGNLSSLLPQGLVGHTAGKTFIRLGGSISRFRLHNTRADSAGRSITANQSLLRLLHYDAVDIAHFIRKMDSRLLKKEGAMGKGKELLLEQYKCTSRCAEDNELVNLFRRLYSLNAQQLELLESSSTVVGLDPQTLRFKDALAACDEPKDLRVTQSPHFFSPPKRRNPPFTTTRKLFSRSASLAFRWPFVSRRPEVKKPRRLFVILTQPRSGSYLLVDLLNQVPGVRCHPEIFKPNRLELWPDARHLIKWTVAGRDERPIRYMKAVLSLGDYEASGFKLFPEHNKRLLSHVSSADYVHKVVLMRHPLSRYISLMRAQATGRWVHRNDDHRLHESEIKCRFDSARFELFLRHHEHFSDWTAAAAADAPHRYVLVNYEDVVSLRAIENIARLLGVPAVDTSIVKPTIEKQTKEPLPDLVANYGAMKTYIATNHGSMLSQPGCPQFD